MKRTELQKHLRLKSRQHVDNVLAGRSNLILWRARIAAKVVGGDVEMWQDPARAKGRLKAFNKLS